MADVTVLAEALTSLLRDGDPGPAGAYSDASLRRVWRATHFSWWMTSMLHVDPGPDRFGAELQLAQLRYVIHQEKWVARQTRLRQVSEYASAGPACPVLSRLARAAASAVTSAMARLRPLAPVGGTMCAASPARNSRR